MKSSRPTAILFLIGLSSLLEADPLSGFTHFQEINFLEEGIPEEITLGMQTELRLEYSDTEFTNLSFAIPEAELGFVADSIDWEFGTDAGGNSFFEITGHFEDDVFKGLNFIEASYLFTSDGGASLEMPLDDSLLSDLADFNFTFAGNNTQGAQDQMTGSVYQGSMVTVPELSQTPRIISIFAATFLFHRRSARTAG